ncbi:MAG TPA: hypothetical protein P5555_06980 [Candidatus Paceibacterota bacterium]|nr:hypothetical protein [Verrucomicrobiota bacterium]HOX02484.1 hypothetical protein [Verrucomicrobiota bacterium]HRZ44918.1 hypothetical protein [Candidatus Paceibacterota bacterium]HRZ92353.1 hypothetical protein [Candidatus Paceibacterota bacterium]
MHDLLRFVAGLALVLTSCATIREQPALTVELADLRLRNATLWETTGEMMVRIENAEPDPIRLAGGAHRIYLNGEYVGQGLTHEALEIPGLGTASQAIAVHFRNLALVGRLRPMLESAQFDYQIHSRLYGIVGSRDRRWSVSSSGRLDLRGLARPALAEPGTP